MFNEKNRNESLSFHFFQIYSSSTLSTFTRNRIFLSNLCWVQQIESSHLCRTKNTSCFECIFSFGRFIPLVLKVLDLEGHRQQVFYSAKIQEITESQWVKTISASRQYISSSYLQNVLLLLRFAIGHIPFYLAFILAKHSSLLGSFSALLTIAQAGFRVLAVVKVTHQAYFAGKECMKVFYSSFNS